MGAGRSKLPPISERDLRTVLAYLLEERHILKLWNKFLEMDDDCNGVWTIAELYNVVQEPRGSIRAPIIDALFFMADGNNDGTVCFQDFLVTFCSFCALSKEEMIQLFFIIVDKDRNGRVEKEELVEFFSYTGGPGEFQGAPAFPLNNRTALDKFRGGKWTSLEFDGLALLCESFPYIIYPVLHTQELYRSHFLGKSFWLRLDNERRKSHGNMRKRRVFWPGTSEKVEVALPGRCTMQEVLEYSKRKTTVESGKRVENSNVSLEVQSSITEERDNQIAHSPLLSMIRNPRCMYYVPYQPPKKVLAPQQSAYKLDLELPAAADPSEPGSPPGTASPGPGPRGGQHPAGFRAVSLPPGVVLASNVPKEGDTPFVWEESDSSVGSGFADDDR